MKILFTVEFYEPSKGGAQEVIKQMAERFAKDGHDASVATSYLPNRKSKNINGVKIEDFKISGNLVRGIDGDESEIKRYRNLLVNGDFDLILNYAAQIWTTDLMFEILDDISAKKILAPVGYSGLKNSKYSEYFKKLPGYLRKYDLLIYHSDSYQDFIFGEKNGLSNKSVTIHNGASYNESISESLIDVRKELGIKTKYLIISVANHYKAKGHDFVLRAFKKMNRKDVSLLIIGDKKVSYGWRRMVHFFYDYLWCWLSSKINKNIFLSEGKNRDFVVSAYKQADIFLFGSRVECAPLVMYEAFASKTIFVSTPVGNVPDYDGVVKIVKSEKDMASVANNLLDNESSRLAITENAYNEWLNKYTWDKIYQDYKKEFEKIL